MGSRDTTIVVGPADTQGEPGGYELGRPDEGSCRFVTRGELGRGGMGVVLRAFDPRLLRDVAMKRLDPPVNDDAARRFVQEAQITGQLEHSSVVPVHELGIDADGALYLNMKLVNGATLHDLRQAEPARLEPRRLAELLEVLLRLCDAVAFAHSRGVVHRDLKPSNVMVGEFGQVYLMDWGIARVVGDGPAAVQVGEPVRDGAAHVIGTASFMAPEQAQGRNDDIDERTDVFGLGALLYFVLSGHGPYTDGPTLIMLHRAADGLIEPLDPDALGLPRALIRIAMRAMAFRPGDRYPSAIELRRELEDFLHGTWNLREVRVPAGTVFLREGDPGESAYLVKAGRCRVFTGAGGATLRELGPGEVFGEAAVFARGPRSASIEALTEVVLLEVDRESLERGLGLNGWMGAFVTALADRFLEIERRRRD